MEHAFSWQSPRRTEKVRARRALADAVGQSSQEIIALARTLVVVPSAYPPGDTYAVADLVESMFEGIDAQVERYAALAHVMNH